MQEKKEPNLSILLKVHYFPKPQKKQTPQKPIIPTSLKPKIEEWTFMLARKKILSYFKALMNYIDHFRGEKIHFNLKQSISGILIKMSQWQVLLKRVQDPIHLSQIELNLRIAIYEIENVEKCSELEKVAEKLAMSPEEKLATIALLNNVLAHGHTNLFAIQGSDDTKEKLQQFNQNLHILKKEGELFKDSQVYQSFEEIKTAWVELNESVIYDYRIYYAKRAEALQAIALLAQFLEDYKSLLKTSELTQKIEVFTANSIDQITPENLDDLVFSTQKYREMLYTEIQQKLQRPPVENGNESSQGMLIQAIKSYMKAKRIAFNLVKDSHKPCLYQGNMADGKKMFIDFERLGYIQISGELEKSQCLNFVDNLAQFLLLNFGFELSHT
ncbi:hypothetical protein ACFL35_10700 [Candidatus Riflebacteria bacterium]